MDYEWIMNGIYWNINPYGSSRSFWKEVWLGYDDVTRGLAVPSDSETVAMDP